MADGIIRMVFDRRTELMTDWYSASVIEEMERELAIEIKNELDSSHFRKSCEQSMFKK